MCCASLSLYFGDGIVVNAFSLETSEVLPVAKVPLILFQTNFFELMCSIVKTHREKEYCT